MHACCVLNGVAPWGAWGVNAAGATEARQQDAASFDAAATLAQASALRLAPGGPDADALVQAVALLERVAGQNVTESRHAHYALAEMYELGEVIAGPGQGKAEHHYLQAAAFGSHEALFKLALLDPLQVTDTLVGALPTDDGAALAEVASASGAPAPSGATRARASPSSRPSRRRHPVQQLSQYQSAALAANPDAAVALGYRYKYGVDVVANCSLAATYYEFAVNAGMAQFLVGGEAGGSGGSSSWLDSEFPTVGSSWHRRQHSVRLFTKSKSFSASRTKQRLIEQEGYYHAAARANPDSQYHLGMLLYAAGIDALALLPPQQRQQLQRQQQQQQQGTATAASSSTATGAAPNAAEVTAALLAALGGGGGEAEEVAETTAESLLQQAFELLTLAAEGGSARAHAGLGHMYYQVRT